MSLGKAAGCTCSIDLGQIVGGRRLNRWRIDIPMALSVALSKGGKSFFRIVPMTRFERERVREGGMSSSKMNLAVPEACVVQDLLTLQILNEIVHVKFNGAAFNRRMEALGIPRNTDCSETRTATDKLSFPPCTYIEHQCAVALVDTEI